MAVVGIVAEYDPFHSGHAHQIAATRALLGEDAPVVAVMSGNWTQRGYPAVADKHLRAKLALLGGVDVVLELPTVWAVSSAEGFARGAAAILHASGVVDALSFGSECGDLNALSAVASCLDGADYRDALRRVLDEGKSFPAARQRAVEGVLGRSAGRLLSEPNNNLGVEYLRALNGLQSPVVPVTVPRKGAGHGSKAPAEFASASYLREQLALGSGAGLTDYLSPDALEALAAGDFPSLARVERVLLTRLRTMTAADWAKLPDSGKAEGLTIRLERAGRKCAATEEFFALAGTKRYPRARLARLLLWAFLGLTAQDIPAAPPYLRVLGFTQRGRGLLRQMKDKAALPVVTKPAHAKGLEDAGRRLFELEGRCTDLYGLCFDTVRPAGLEWTRGPVLPEELQSKSDRP